MKKVKLTPWLITAIILLAGGVLLYFKIADYGFSFFMIFPIAVGFSIGTLSSSQKKTTLWASLLFGLLIALVLLVVLGIEGFVCVLLAIPLIALLMLLGLWLSRRYKKLVEKRMPPNQLNIIIFPLLILIVANFFENLLIAENKTITVSNSIVLPYSAEVVFDAVKSMDKLDAEKPFLLKLGLPSPYKCELEENKIGAKRVCLFENGRIVAEVTEFKRGEILKMEVKEYDLLGMQWFKFKDAEYTFEKDKSTTKLTRTTSYKSTIQPRLYWQLLEVYGIEQEHQFVLQSLKKNLQESSANGLHTN